ncbi:hypothetical protein [Fusobacterium sp. PH5-44]|uniref:hypothetical protein n=1 Tax=unclassified Fusobacterium TaxID=2648384 RepID=UPI003D1F9141
MISRTLINTRLAYFMLFTKFDDIDESFCYNTKNSRKSPLDIVIDDFSNRNQLNNFPFLAAIASVRSDEKLGISYNREEEKLKYSTSNMIENINPLAFIYNLYELDKY